MDNQLITEEKPETTGSIGQEVAKKIQEHQLSKRRKSNTDTSTQTSMCDQEKWRRRTCRSQ